MKQLTLDLRPAPDPTLDNFIPGANAELVERLRALAAGAGQDAIYIWGLPGCGRSHLLQATVAAARALGAPCAYLEGRAATGSPAYADDSVLALDGVESLSPEAQIALFRLFNEARARRLRLLLSAGAPPLKLALREDLRTRLGSALVFELRPLSEEEKARALQSHATQRGMGIKPELIQHLLRHAQRDLPTLMAALDALDELSLERKRPVTLPLLLEVMKELRSS
jgi:DnaA family protein